MRMRNNNRTTWLRLRPTNVVTTSHSILVRRRPGFTILDQRTPYAELIESCDEEGLYFNGFTTTGMNDQITDRQTDSERCRLLPSDAPKSRNHRYSRNSFFRLDWVIVKGDANAGRSTFCSSAITNTKRLFDDVYGNGPLLVQGTYMTKDDTEKNAHQSQPKPRIPKAARFVGSVVGVGAFGIIDAGGMLPNSVMDASD